MAYSFQPDLCIQRYQCHVVHTGAHHLTVVWKTLSLHKTDAESEKEKEKEEGKGKEGGRSREVESGGLKESKGKAEDCETQLKSCKVEQNSCQGEKVSQS